MNGSREALIVANDEYSDDELRRLVAPSRDAEMLAEALGDPGLGAFHVQVLRNQTAHAMLLAIEDFFADRNSEDLLLLHFSCHGVKNQRGELFLAASDTRPTRLAATAVSADFVNRQMLDSRAQRIALFLDCCFGGVFPRGMVVRSGSEAYVGEVFAAQHEVGSARGRVVVTASSAMEYAFEGDQLAAGAHIQPSVFTAAVVEGLTSGDADRDGDGWIGLSELFTYVKDRVRSAKGHQTPHMWIFGSEGELLIARSRVRRVRPAPLAPELVEAIHHPLPSTRYGVVEELRERLRSEDLRHALAAWEGLRQMVDDDSHKVSHAASVALADAALTLSPDLVDLGSFVLGERGPRAHVRLSGLPLATAVAASTADSWIHLEQDETVLHISADPHTAGQHRGSIALTGPAGQVQLPVFVDVRPAPPPLITPPAPIAPEEGMSEPQRQSWFRKWRWILAGTAAAVIAAGGVIVILALQRGGTTKRTVDVPATLAWTDTHMACKAGDVLDITATGTINHDSKHVAGPAGDPDPNFRRFNIPELAGVNHAALIGRVDDVRPYFVVGTNASYTCRSGGGVFLGINDANVKDNSGKFTAIIGLRKAR